MKNATPISILSTLLFSLLLTSTVGAQNNYLAQHLQLKPILDTLPDGTIFNLPEFPFERIKPNYEQLKSVVKTDNKTFAPQSTSQANSVHTSRLKATGLIKSLNDGVSSFYTEKIDSILSYDTYLLPQYDSIKTETTDVSIDENGHVVKSITKKIDEQSQGWIYSQKIVYGPDITTGKLLSQIYYVWDNINDGWVEDTKYEYNYDPNGNQILWIKYSWDLLSHGWYLIQKSERVYDENNRVVNYKYFDIEKDGEGVVSSKYEYTYNDKGDRTLFLYCTNWDADLNTWLVQQKTVSTYNQAGERTSYSSLKLNTESNEWDYNYKYEYNYLPDGSIGETYFSGWNPVTKEFRSQTYAKYKYDRLYENNKIVQEIKQDWINSNWQYDWKKTYAYDQWGNQILYELYDPYWGTEGGLKERTIKEFTESGQIVKEERYVRDDEHYEHYEDYEFYGLKGVYFFAYQRDAAEKLTSRTEYRWDEDKREWLVDYRSMYSYPNEDKVVLDRCDYEVSGYSANYAKPELIKLNYDATIGRYTGADESEGFKWLISYNAYLKVDEVISLSGNQWGEKIKCYYNAAGQDTAWYKYYKEKGDWEFTGKTTFAYEHLDNGWLKVSERWISEQDNYGSDYYYENGKIRSDIVKQFDDINKEWILEDSTVYVYNTQGQIISAESLLGEYPWKGELVFANDTLTINTYYKETLNDDWRLEYKDVCKVDPTIGMDKYQQVPKVVTDGGLEWLYSDYTFLGYGKVLECVSHSSEEFRGEDLYIDYKEDWFYSEASVLSGDAVINGYIFNTEKGDMKSVSVANGTQGSRAEGVEISLCARDDDFVLTSQTTDSEGFYQFLGVPKGTFYLKVDLEGYVQNSTHEIQVTDYLTIFEGKNFNVTEGTIVTGLNATSDNGISIYPNPTNGRLTIKSDSPVHSIVIYNTAGIKLAQFNRTNSIDLSGFNKGFYLIQVSTKNENRIQKIHVK